MPERPRGFNAFEPGFIPNTGLGREANVFVRLLLRYILPLFAPHKKYWSNPQRAARVATKVLINAPGETGIYYDDGGQPMLGSTIARDPRFCGSHRCRDTRLAGDDSNIKGEMISFIFVHASRGSRLQHQERHPEGIRPAPGQIACLAYKVGAFADYKTSSFG